MSSTSFSKLVVRGRRGGRIGRGRSTGGRARRGSGNPAEGSVEGRHRVGLVVHRPRRKEEGRAPILLIELDRVRGNHAEVERPDLGRRGRGDVVSHHLVDRLHRRIGGQIVGDGGAGEHAPNGHVVEGPGHVDSAHERELALKRTERLGHEAHRPEVARARPEEPRLGPVEQREDDESSGRSGGAGRVLGELPARRRRPCRCHQLSPGQHAREPPRGKTRSIDPYRYQPTASRGRLAQVHGRFRALRDASRKNGRRFTGSVIVSRRQDLPNRGSMFGATSRANCRSTSRR